MNSASLCCLGGRYENPIPPRFLAPIDFSKIPALSSSVQTFKESRNRFQRITSASPWSSLAGRGRYDNPIPTWILAPIDCLKISALASRYDNPIPTRFLTPAQYRDQILCGFMRAQISFELWHGVGHTP